MVDSLIHTISAPGLKQLHRATVKTRNSRFQSLKKAYEIPIRDGPLGSIKRASGVWNHVVLIIAQGSQGKIDDISIYFNLFHEFQP